LLSCFSNTSLAKSKEKSTIDEAREAKELADILMLMERELGAREREEELEKLELEKKKSWQKRK
jgi:hypothetical protein